MSTKTGIEWTEATWNPVTGCTKVSQGCRFCYAERDWARLAAPRTPPNIYTGRAFTEVRCHPERLIQPWRWTTPRRIFVNSMSDLFHEAVPFEFIASVFAIMGVTTRHTYQVLTKRPERMLEFFQWVHEEFAPSDFAADERIFAHFPKDIPWEGMKAYRRGYDNCGPLYPYENVWLGVSVEDQETANERIPLLLETPAAVRWLSIEPLLSPVDLLWTRKGDILSECECGGNGCDLCEGIPRIDWVVVGGESGPNARPFSIDAARAIVQQCAAAGVPCFVKQIGRYPYSEAERWSIRGGGVVVSAGDPWTFRDELGDRKGGDPNEWPEYLRVREYPA